MRLGILYASHIPGQGGLGMRLEMRQGVNSGSVTMNLYSVLLPLYMGFPVLYIHVLNHRMQQVGYILYGTSAL